MLTDAALITLYTTLAVLIAGITVSFMVHGGHKKLSNAFYGISGCLMGWLIVTIAYHVTSSPALAEYVDILAFPFISFLPVILVVFVFRFYRGRSVVRKRTIVLLSILPAATTLISVVPSLNWLLWGDYTMRQIYPLHIADYHWNVWYYIHAGYSYILMAACALLVIRQYKKQPGEYKLPSVLIIVCIGIFCLSDLPSFSMPDAVVDHTLIGVCLSMMVLYIAIVNNPMVGFLGTARKALFNNMDIPVFMLDKQDFVLEMNRAAHELLEALHFPNKDNPFLNYGDIIGAISRHGGIFKDSFVGDGVAQIVLPLDDENIVFNPVRREMTDKRGRPLGSYVALMDITRLSQIVDELQYRAEIDVLTGIPNRRAFEHKRAEVDIAENLPISFIVGDVNGLKPVNDQFGHRQGDLLLKTVAGILTNMCPEGGFAARIGGDEFIMLIPHCDMDGAQSVVNNIHAQLKTKRDLFPGASIALGHITKNWPEEDIHELIHKADMLMYSQKKNDRRRRR